jgi:ribosome-associated protein
MPQPQSTPPQSSPTSEAKPRSQQLAELAARIADDNRAKDIKILDLRGLTSVFDFFVIATGGSVRQLHAISDEIETAARETLNDRKLGSEGYSQGGWVLIDFGDVVVHLFDADAREYYALEDLWGQAPQVPFNSTGGLSVVEGTQG